MGGRVNRRKWFVHCCLGISIFGSGLAVAADFTFLFKGDKIASFDLEQLKKKVAPVTLKVNELHESRSAEFRGIPFYPLLKLVYGDKLAQGDEIVFTCLDGYKPSIPLRRFEKHTSLLTFEKVSGDYKFSDEKNHKEIEYGPYYLIWENLKDPILKTEGNEDWPYQLVSADLVQFQDRFPNLSPPANAPFAAKEGFLAYRKQCLQCHTINGEGGDKGFELNYPASVTEYMNEKWLVKWISDPRSLRYNATMPQVNPSLPDRDKVIHEIVAYLKAMAKNKKAPLKTTER